MKEPNIIRIKALGGSYYEQDVILNSKECQLLLDKTNPEASWDLMCKSIAHREGIEINQAECYKHMLEQTTKWSENESK